MPGPELSDSGIRIIRGHDRRPCFSGTRGAERQLHCSICGSPLRLPGQAPAPRWLEDILVMPMSREQFIATPVEYIDGVDRADTNAWMAWDAWDDPGPKCGIPVHRVCLELADSVIKSIKGEQFSCGGPPSSLLDVLNVLRARLMNLSDRGPIHAGMYRLPEPTGYGGIWHVMDIEGWTGRFGKEERTWQADPTVVLFDELPARTDRTPTLRLPMEILQSIFDDTWDNEDASSVPEYLFPPSLWYNRIRKMPLLKGIPLPDDCDWEELARRISRIVKGEAVPGAEALRNRIRIWKLIADMRFNDNYDLRCGLCECWMSPCSVKSDGGDSWCQGSWSEWERTHPSARIPPRLDDLMCRPALLDNSGRVSEDQIWGQDRPIPEYIVRSKKNISLRAWLDSR